MFHIMILGVVDGTNNSCLQLPQFHCKIWCGEFLQGCKVMPSVIKHVIQKERLALRPNPQERHNIGGKRSSIYRNGTFGDMQSVGLCKANKAATQNVTCGLKWCSS